jgi:glycosyltransferase involved in cell wall biosynthesis
MARAFRVGFDARLLGATGIGRYIEGLLPELVRQGPDFNWVVFGRSATAEHIQERCPGARFVRSDAAVYRVAEQVWLPWAFRRAHLDLLHAPHYNLPLLYRGRAIVTIHDLIPLAYPDIHSGWLPRQYNRVLIRAAVRQADAIITPSQSTAEDLKRRLRPRCPVYSIPEGVAPHWFVNGETPPDLPKVQALGVVSPYFLYVGQWKPYRNIPLALRALVGVRRRVPAAELVVAGRRDPRYPEIPALADHLGLGDAVKFVGAVPDDMLRALYRHAAALVVPSYQEGFGLPVLEAMASGTPVICSDIPALRETAGGAAALCAPDDEAGFVRELVRALDPSERARRALAGRRQAAAFSWPAAAHRTLEVYRHVLGSAA